MSQDLDSFGRAIMCECTVFGNPRVECATGVCPECKDGKLLFKCPKEQQESKRLVTLKELKKQERRVVSKGSGDTTKKFVEERIVHDFECGRLKKRLLDTFKKPMKFMGFQQDTGFTEHRFIAHNQNRAFSNTVKNLENGQVVVVADFGSNLSFCATEETQGEFFSPAQAAIFPIMVCMWVREAGGSHTKKAFACDVLSDDLKHDSGFVQGTFGDLVQWVKDKAKENNGEFDVDFFHAFTDGCREQFKNKDNIGWVTMLTETLKVRGFWHFFCSCHGKGGSDAETSVIHRFIRRMQLKLDRINFAKDACDICVSDLRKIPRSVSEAGEEVELPMNAIHERFLIWHDHKQMADIRKRVISSQKACAGSNNHCAFASSEEPKKLHLG